MQRSIADPGGEWLWATAGELGLHTQLSVPGMSRVKLSAELFPSGVEAAGRGLISLGGGRLLELEGDAWLEPTLRVEKWEGWLFI